MDLRKAVRARLVNPAVCAILPSPAHRLLSDSLIVVSFAGRTSGRTYSLPVMYARDGDGDLVVLVGDPERKTWWRNLRNAAPVRVVLAGREITAEGVVLDTVTHPADVIGALDAYGRRFPRAVPGEDPGPAVVFVRLHTEDSRARSRS